jgi:hypothetical protein
MNNSLISVFSGFIFTQDSAVGGERRHTVQCRACQKTASDVCLQLAFHREWFHIGWKKNMSGQFHNSRCLYSGLTSLCSSTSWRTLYEFFILWKRPSCHGPLKTYSTNSIRSLIEELTAVTSFPSVISPEQSLPADTSTCFSRRHHFSPWLVKWKCFWSRTR